MVALSEGPMVLAEEIATPPFLAPTFLAPTSPEMAAYQEETPLPIPDRPMPLPPTSSIQNPIRTSTLPPLMLTSTPPSTPNPPVRICPPPGGWYVTTVQSGDTLAGLAGKYHTTADSLAKANCLTADTTLSSGTVVYVPGPSAPATESCKPPPGWVKYIIQNGDTLALIAYRANSTAQKIQEANCMGNSTLIKVGQTLSIPAQAAIATSAPWHTPTSAFYYPSATIYPYYTPFATLIYATPQTPQSPYPQVNPSYSETPMLQAPWPSVTSPPFTTPWPTGNPSDVSIPWPSATAALR